MTLDKSDREMAIRSDAQAIFNTPKGEKFLRRLRMEVGLWNPIGTTDPVAMAYFQGQRDFVIEIMRLSGKWITEDEELANTDYPQLPQIQPEED